MTVALTRFLTEAEREALNDDAMSRGYYRDDYRIFQPGWGWHCPWYWDPAKAAQLGITKDTPYSEAEAKANREDWHLYGYGLLSRYYWETWSTIRPPICVVLPNGVHWEIDRKSSNGEGWTVSGDWPNLSCSPSIAAGGYHGFLQNGAFTADCERPASPDGVYPYPRTWSRKVRCDPADPRRIYHETVDGDPPADHLEVEPAGGWIRCRNPNDAPL